MNCELNCDIQPMDNLTKEDIFIFSKNHLDMSMHLNLNTKFLTSHHTKQIYCKYEYNHMTVFGDYLFIIFLMLSEATVLGCKD